MLSFIVPTYNPKPEIFDKCVKSLKEQALADWEAIFVLDGPSKVARDTIKRNRDDRFRIVEIEHSGAQAARNKGGSEARGDLLCFFDCDCILEPGASKMWVEQFDKHPEVGFIYSGYKFCGEQYAIESEPWDPWTLRIRNYISGCFPMRRKFYPGWTPGLKSLQDWDMWLSLVEGAESMGSDISKLGMFIRGYAFTTPLPDAGSISGEGCKESVWLERMDAVKKRHSIPDNPVCVSSLAHPHDGKALAKAIGADFLTIANDKPHRYKTIIQVGFSLGKDVEKHADMFKEKEVKKVLFWTPDNINEMYHSVSFQQIDAMSQLLNDVCKQYCEDKESQRLLSRAGFKAEILPMPIGPANVMPMPKEKKWAVDASGSYSPIISVVAQSVPDIQLDYIGPATRLSEYCGLIHFFPDRSMSNTIKRAILTGRHIISNVDEPFCNRIDDKGEPEKFVTELVEAIRSKTHEDHNRDAVKFYEPKANLAEVLA